MYYTAEERICVATANSPTGPFIQQVQEPIIPNRHTIDNTLFIDEDGTPYIFYVDIDKRFYIKTTKLNSDLATVEAGEATICLTPDQRWEMMEGEVNEGPSIIKHKGIYYLLYSGNAYTSRYYGVGYASSKNLRGPWSKSDNNPILQLPGELVGAGHGAPFHDKRGRLHYVFHAHNSNHRIHPRCMYIARMRFKRTESGIKLCISDKYITPKVVK